MEILRQCFPHFSWDKFSWESKVQILIIGKSGGRLDLGGHEVEVRWKREEL